MLRKFEITAAMTFLGSVTVVVLFLAVAIVVAVVGSLSGCDNNNTLPPNNSKEWTHLGNVEGPWGSRYGIVQWMINPANGDRVYVLIGYDKGGIYVVPGEKKEKTP